MKILQELLSATEELPYLQAPVYFDYGCNTFFGKFSSANFNFTCLDVCQIHIGDNVTKILKNRFIAGDGAFPVFYHRSGCGSGSKYYS